MKTILYLATSVNGHITLGNDDTDWAGSKTIDDFRKLNLECGIVVMGRRTFEMFGKDFPQPNCLNVVITTDKNLLGKSLDGALFTDKSPKEIVEMATIKGFRKLFLVGGEKINSSFLKDNLIDQIWTNIHPLLIGNGKYLFEEINNINTVDLELLSCVSFDEQQVLLKYKVKK